MHVELSYGMARDKNSGGDNLEHIGKLIQAKYKSAHVEITTVPSTPHVPVGVVSMPIILIGHSAGSGAILKWAKDAGVPIALMINSDTFPLLTDGMLVAPSFNQPAFVQRLVAFRQHEGILQGKPCVNGHNWFEYVLDPIAGQTGTEPHTGVLYRPDVIANIMAEVDVVAQKYGVT